MTRIRVPYLSDEMLRLGNLSFGTSAVLVPADKIMSHSLQDLLGEVLLFNTGCELKARVHSVAELDMDAGDDSFRSLIWALDAKHCYRYPHDTPWDALEHFLDQCGYVGTEKRDWNRPRLMILHFKQAK